MLKGRKSWLVLGALAVILLALWVAFRHVPWSYVASRQPQTGPFFRITANYLYRGKPLTLDFALGCGGIVTTYKDKDRSVDLFGGPQLYGARTEDSKAVAISTT